MSAQIMTLSYKYTGEAIYVKPALCKDLQELFFKRYPGIALWQSEVKRRLQRNKYLVSASGHKRRFLGDVYSHAVQKTALSNEPQENTTYATNLALKRLWEDPENEGPIIQPLHTVHDALCGQFPKSRTEWAIEKIRSYFDNPMWIAGQQITIPFDGAYGPSWGELYEGTI